MISINSIAIPIVDTGGRLTKNASPKGGIMVNLTAVEREVANRLGLNLERVTAMKKNPIVGRALHGENGPGPYAKPYPGKRQISPFPNTDGTYEYADPSEPYDASPGARPAGATKVRTDKDRDDDLDDARKDLTGLGVPRRMLRPKFPARKK